MVKGASTGERIGAFFAGFGILRAVALIPGLGFIVWFLACIYGLGALTRAAWRAGREPSAEVPPAAPAPEPLPTASPGAPADEAPPAQEQAPTTPAG
jgi:nitrate reductase NapE component